MFCLPILNEQELVVIVDRISKEFFNKPFMHEVIYNNRLRTTGGRYIPSLKRIELNPKYLIEMGEDEFIGIIKHELCHYHLHIEGKGYKHGDQEFKDLLKKTNSPRYCQPLPSQQKKKKHLYICIKCRHPYYRIRRINVKRYSCGKCGGRLKHINKK